MSGTANPAAWTRTTCPYCGTGCGVSARRVGATVEVAGDPAHPTNAGRLCVKGSALGDTVGSAGRLLHPQIRQPGGGWRQAAWTEALDAVAQGFAQTVLEHGPDAVAWYVSGQLLTEDYYVANKLVKGYIGTANIDTNSRLCMSSAVAGHKRAFGEDIVPVSYADLDQASLVVLVGSNTAWCHPILFQRLLKAREQRPQMKLVVIDPRRTATSAMSDLHLPLRAGSDVWLFNGLLCDLARRGLHDPGFLDRHTRGAAETLALAMQDADAISTVAQHCGLEPAQVAAFYQLFAEHAQVVTAFSMGVNQSSAGTDKVNSIINCHLFTGRIGKPGAGPFSITGQPNAMGGREVGGLANTLAAHLDLEHPEHRALVQGFWGSPRIAAQPGLKAMDLFDAIGDGRIKAVWIMATNPVVSLPDADRIRAALAGCPLVVVSEVVSETDTSALAHIRLPAQGWGEKDGTVTNSERCISRQRAFLPAPGEARPDWWMLSEVARRWGYGAHFGYRHPRQIFDEYARLTALDNGESGSCPRYLNLTGLVGLGAAGYDRLAPVRWPVRAPGDTAPPPVFADGRYYHPDRRARLVPVTPRAPVHAPGPQFPLVLNTGRVRDHWHTMTRTGLSPRLASHLPEPYVDLHPQDALACGVAEHSLARVRSRWGSCVVRVRLSGEMARGSVFVPIHWNGQFSSDARVGSLVNPVADPISGEPEFKHTPVQVTPFAVDWYGFLLLRTGDGSVPDTALLHRLLPGLCWWTRVAGAEHARFEIAGRTPLAAGAAPGQALQERAPDAQWMSFEDPAHGAYRAAQILEDGRLSACLFVDARPELPDRGWLCSLFAQPRLNDAARRALLAGALPARDNDQGPTICSCFGVGRTTLLRAIRTQGLRTPAALGQQLKCGTNCGSCIPELQRLIDLTCSGAPA